MAIRPEAPPHPRQETANLAGKGDVQPTRAGLGKHRIAELHLEKIGERILAEDLHTDRGCAVGAHADESLLPARRKPTREVDDRDHGIARVHPDDRGLVREVGRLGRAGCEDRAQLQHLRGESSRDERRLGRERELVAVGGRRGLTGETDTEPPRERRAEIAAKSLASEKMQRYKERLKNSPQMRHRLAKLAGEAAAAKLRGKPKSQDLLLYWAHLRNQPTCRMNRFSRDE